MKEEIKTQKGFIQIPLLIGIIVSIVVASAGTVVVLHKQGKLTSLTANISEVFKKTEESAIIDFGRETEVQKLQIEEERETTQESKKASGEIEKLKEIIKKQQIQIDKLLSRSSEIKEIIKEVPKEIIKEVIREVPIEKIVYKEICSCPQTQPEISEERFITYSGSEFGGRIHDYFPIITSFSADPSPSNIRLKVGNEIHFKVEASDPYGRQILYRWWCSTCGLGYSDWATNNEIRYKITSEDIKKSGESMRIGVYIKSEKEYYRTGEHGYDDGIYTDYRFSF